MKRIALSALALAFSLTCAFPVWAEEGQINVNTATSEQLAAIFNAEVAEAIVKYRGEIGDFMSIDELGEVEGMTKEFMDKAKTELSVDAIAGAECNC